MNIDDPAYRRLFERIGILARERYHAAERQFATIGLNHTEARLLVLLDQAGGKSAQDALSSQLMIDRSNAGRALKKLEAAGFIGRMRSQTDRRGYDVTMTDAGRHILTDINRLREMIIGDLLGNLTLEEARQAAMLLDKASSRSTPH